MSPNASSAPRMSVRVVYLPSWNTRPIAMPATGALIGTPASISDSVEPQTDAIDVEPFDASTSETTRSVYGHSSLLGTTGSERPLGERAVTDLAALRRTDAARLTGGERREVVVVHVALAVVEPIVSSICSMRGMPSVATDSTWVSPRWKRPGAVRRGDDADLGRERTEVGRRRDRRCGRPRSRCARARPASAASGTPS